MDSIIRYLLYIASLCVLYMYVRKVAVSFMTVFYNVKRGLVLSKNYKGIDVGSIFIVEMSSAIILSSITGFIFILPFSLLAVTPVPFELVIIICTVAIIHGTYDRLVNYKHYIEIENLPFAKFFYTTPTLKDCFLDNASRLYHDYLQECEKNGQTPLPYPFEEVIGYKAIPYKEQTGQEDSPVYRMSLIEDQPFLNKSESYQKVLNTLQKYYRAGAHTEGSFMTQYNLHVSICSGSEVQGTLNIPLVKKILEAETSYMIYSYDLNEAMKKEILHQLYKEQSKSKVVKCYFVNKDSIEYYYWLVQV